MSNQLLFCSLFVFGVGCGIQEPNDNSSIKVTNGSSINLSQYSNVVSLRSTFQDGTNPSINLSTICTGTLVNPTTIITAAHCIDGDNSDINDDGSVDIFQSTAFRFESEAFQNGTLLPNPEWSDFDNNGVNGNDAGILFSAAPSPTSGTPLCDSEALEGDAFTIVGFGCNDYNATGDDCNGSGTFNKRTGSNTIAGVGDLITFNGNSNNVAGDGTNVASGSGDSGGPLLISQNGVECIAGITSGGFTFDTDGDSQHDSKQSSYVNIHNASTQAFFSENLPGTDCDIYETNCPTRVDDLVSRIWGPFESEFPAPKSSYIYDLTTDAAKLKDIEDREILRYGRDIVAPRIIPMLSLLI
ncbi:MAG: trypsin-like serine protease [Pseudobacteriovorax sp.]|nr:trypsin-like serine protease [Pseudobacteriovorax sp.]